MAILLCSRNDTVRNRWFSALHPDWKMHQATSVEQVYSILKRFRIELLLLHRSLMSAEQLQELCSRVEGVKMFVLADRPDDRDGVYCLRLGCVGYANSYISKQRLRTAVESIESGLAWVGRSLMQYLVHGKTDDEPDIGGVSPKREKQVLEQLSNRELQIARMVADGMHNAEIATELDIAERTVKAHLSAIYAKTQADSRVSLALLVKKIS